MCFYIPVYNTHRHICVYMYVCIYKYIYIYMYKMLYSWPSWCLMQFVLIENHITRFILIFVWSLAALLRWAIPSQETPQSYWVPLAVAYLSSYRILSSECPDLCSAWWLEGKPHRGDVAQGPPRCHHTWGWQGTKPGYLHCSLLHRLSTWGSSF